MNLISTGVKMKEIQYKIDRDTKDKTKMQQKKMSR